MSNVKTDQLRSDLDALRQDVIRLRDELRVQLHLGGMDARDTFERLDRTFRETEQDVEVVARDATRKISDEWTKVRDGLSALRAELTKKKS